MDFLKKLVKIFINYQLAGTYLLYLLFETLVARSNKAEISRISLHLKRICSETQHLQKTKIQKMYTVMIDETLKLQYSVQTESGIIS